MEEIKIANTLIEASENLRKLFPETYDEKSKFVQKVIRNVMAAHDKDVLPAALECMEKAAGGTKESHR